MNKEVVEINDIITLDNNKEYLVSGKTVYNNVNYLYLINKEDYSLAFAAISGNRVIILNNKEDKILIEELMPLFLKSITESYMKLYNKKNDN